MADGEIMRVGETGSKSSILVLDLPNTDDTACLSTCRVYCSSR